MKKGLYESINVKLPDGFRTMTEEEVRMYYSNIIFDRAFIEPEKKA